VLGLYFNLSFWTVKKTAPVWATRKHVGVVCRHACGRPSNCRAL